MPTTSKIRRILKRYARLSTNGRPIRCTPSAKELRLGDIARREKAGTDGKVIYDSRDIARAAAEHLARETGYLLREYQCGRSKSGHYHLTTDRSAMRKARKAA